MPELDVAVGTFLAPFFGPVVEQKLPTRLSLNYEMYLRLQTCSPEGLKQLDKVIKKLK
jgi:hypothetical protein